MRLVSLNLQTCFNDLETREFALTMNTDSMGDLFKWAKAEEWLTFIAMSVPPAAPAFKSIYQRMTRRGHAREVLLGDEEDRPPTQHRERWYEQGSSTRVPPIGSEQSNLEDTSLSSRGLEAKIQDTKAKTWLELDQTDCVYLGRAVSDVGKAGKIHARSSRD